MKEITANETTSNTHKASTNQASTKLNSVVFGIEGKKIPSAWTACYNSICN